MKRVLFALLFASAFALGVAAQQTVNLTTPVSISDSTCRLKELVIHPSIGNVSQAEIIATVENPAAGLTQTKVYNGGTNPTGQTLVNQLNTSNNSVTSLIARVYSRLNTDGVCVGTVTGSPQH